MKSFPQNSIMRLGAFVGVMALCYGFVMIGAWRMSVVTPTLKVSLPSFSAAIKASNAGLLARKTDPCPLPPSGVLHAGACETEKHMCGRHDIDSCGAPSVYCGCHAHDDRHPGATAAGAPDLLSASVIIVFASHDRLPVPDYAAAREFLLVFESERTPSLPLT